MKFRIFAILAILMVSSVLLSIYVVDETEQVVVTRFEKVNRTVTNPGLKVRIPFIEKTLFFPKNLQEWDGDPGQVPTKDKTYIWVDTFARWKIVDPETFFKTVRDVNRAKQRLDEIIDPAVRNFITSNRLIEAVRNSNRSLDSLDDSVYENGQNSQNENYKTSFEVFVGRDQIDSAILNQAKPKLAKFGIEIVDVKFKRINYVKEVRDSVYKRMIAERKQIAEKFRSEGQGEANKIAGEKERELKKIESEAYKTAQEIMGTADAEATRLYAKSFGLDPEFYSFTKTLKIYEKALSGDSSVVMSTASDIFRYLKGLSVSDDKK